MKTQYDLIVIGAGPSGIAMASECAQAGMEVLLLDEQLEAGGQIYRGVSRSRLRAAKIFDENYWRGAKLVNTLKCEKLTHVAGARIWHALPSGEVWFSVSGESTRASAKTLAIAIGARERPVAIPGWTLPGVFTVGAAQVMLKSAAIAVHGAVLAGSGPLLYLVAAQYIAAGRKVRALLDTTPWRNYPASLRALPGAIGHGQLYKGLNLLARIRLAGVAVHNCVSELRIHGDTAVEGIGWKARGKTHRLPCDAVLLHEGLVPNVELGLALGCDWSWSSERRAWELTVGENGETSQPNIYALGDCARIVGADASEIQGRLAALHLVRNTTGQQLSARETSLVHELRKHMRLRRFLDRLYSPSDRNLLASDPSTVVCRCESVTIGTLAPLMGRANGNLNFVKSFTRCGMGPCQGRMCSHSVAALGREGQLPLSAPPRQRLPLSPITIGELAAVKDDE
ncbi:FAD-dependent oxidoreductase [Hydrogenophaga sp. ANAO-22]|jgi:NADPH-dependent 2,4-dienoyl-CoA reductase/sulfur reductase-like enzyme|uniref:FAD-dependent oxidoreductase n=1 Tax=Hydrogenophaga sp. ANAO-22 TaxID=3166645 RepID=UPI0036D2FD6E